MIIFHSFKFLFLVDGWDIIRILDFKILTLNNKEHAKPPQSERTKDLKIWPSLLHGRSGLQYDIYTHM